MAPHPAKGFLLEDLRNDLQEGEVQALMGRVEYCCFYRVIRSGSTKLLTIMNTILENIEKSQAGGYAPVYMPGDRKIFDPNPVATTYKRRWDPLVLLSG